MARVEFWDATADQSVVLRHGYELDNANWVKAINVSSSIKLMFSIAVPVIYFNTTPSIFHSELSPGEAGVCAGDMLRMDSPLMQKSLRTTASFTPVPLRWSKCSTLFSILMTGWNGHDMGEGKKGEVMPSCIAKAPRNDLIISILKREVPLYAEQNHWVTLLIQISPQPQRIDVRTNLVGYWKELLDFAIEKNGVPPPQQGHCSCPSAAKKDETMEEYLTRNEMQLVSEIYGDKAPNIISISLGLPVVCQSCDHQINPGVAWAICLICPMRCCHLCRPAECAAKDSTIGP